MGIHKSDPGYLEIKSRFDEWIQTGESWSGSVELMRYGRRADIDLPKKNNRAAIMNLKVVVKH
jgi:hypothetical protein